MKTKKEYNREYYEVHKEELREKGRARYHAKKGQIDQKDRKKYLKTWQQENKEHIREYRDATKDKRNARRRELYAQDETRRIAAREQSRQFWKKNPRKRKAQRLRAYQITAEEFDRLMEKQHHKCAICGYSDMSNPSFFPMVDHCHKTGKVRGLLCMNCNHGLGKFMDSTELLANAIVYLEGNGSSGVD